MESERTGRGKAFPVDGDLHPWPGLPLEEAWTLAKEGLCLAQAAAGDPWERQISGTIRWEGIFNYFQRALTEFSLCAMYLEGIGNTKINKTPPAPEEP